MSRIVLVWVSLSVLACGGLQNPFEPATPYVRVGDETASATITPAGGTLALSNGTKIEFPPGAVAADTVVTMRRVDGPPKRDYGPIATLILEPHDLRLSATATLTVPYDASAIGDQQDLGAVVSSLSYPEVDVGGELSRWRRVGATFDSGVATLQLDHFSIWHINEYPWAMAALDIPPKYLRDGDLLYALTSSKQHVGASSFPIHVGVFAEQGVTGAVVESTVADKGCTDDFGQGVGFHDFARFRSLCGRHIYLGARRPARGWTPEKGHAAVLAAEGDLGRTYGILGVIPPTGMSCVELSEDAWEDAGINITYIPDEILTPWDQYLRTVPVSTIEVRADEKEVRIPVIMVYRNSEDLYDAAGTAPPFRPPATLTLTPRGVEHPVEIVPVRRGQSDTQWFAEIVFRPKFEDAGQTFAYDARIGNDQRVLMEDEFVAFDVKPVEACPWTGKSSGAWQFSGTLTGTADGRKFAIEDTIISVARPQEGELVVITNSSQYGKEGAVLDPDGGLLSEGRTRDAVFSAGTAHSWGIEADAPEDPTGEAHLGPTRFDCRTAGLQAYEPVRGSSIVYDISGDCRTITMRISASARHPRFEDEGPGCAYEATLTAVRKDLR